MKSIPGIKSRVQALEILDRLSALGYLKYTLDSKTKKLTYQLTDWVVKCSGEECMNGTAYIRLVQKVINDKIHGPYQLGIYTYDDIFQIGCIGLCKAAATDKGGTFSTYAYRLIWNEVCDALIYSTKRHATEFSSDRCFLVSRK